MKPTGPTNIHLQQLITELKEASRKNNVNIWRTIALELEKPTRRRRLVNIRKLNKVTKPNETIIVPGKVLGAGEPAHKLKIAAYQFSTSAQEKLQTTLTIPELIKENPKGKNVRIIG
jgi:large subunit ribosomal protein L18e